MVKEKINKMTLDKLANMVAKGFEHEDKRFDAIDKRLDEHDKRFDAVEQKLGKIDYQVDAIHDAVIQLEEGDILNLQKRVGALEKTVKGFGKQLG